MENLTFDFGLNVAEVAEKESLKVDDETSCPPEDMYYSTGRYYHYDWH